VAVAIALVSIMYFYRAAESNRQAFLLVTLIAADVAVFVVFGAYQLHRLFLMPLSETIPAIEAIAGGDLARRVPIGASEEFANLASSVNRMTDRLLDERLHLVRAEKLAGIGRLAAGIAHEVGNPLGAIHGYVHLIRRAGADNPAVLESAAALEAESARIDRIIRSLLDYARPRRMTPSPVDVNDAIQAVVKLLTDQGVFRHIDVQLVLDAGHPATVGERHELEQVFVNLFVNAADAMNGKGLIAVRSRRVTVAELAAGAERRVSDPLSFRADRDPSPRLRGWLSAKALPDEVIQVVVADGGTGVAPGEEERIFDPFYTTKEPGKGTGLGLAVVARVVENAGGVIWVRGSREGGAAFIVLLPLRP
jgi:signal transduction histidine kinase